METEADSHQGSRGPKALHKPPEAPLFLYDSHVTVLVGQEPENQRVNLNKNLVVCCVSGFFSAAIIGNFKKADGTITLPEQDPKTFNTSSTGYTPAISEVSTILRQSKRLSGGNPTRSTKS
ncbi:hypothetical protein ABVK25_010919 [Lepraria finkii]|uniref:Uncharacterized protein n=1 Tax=Lepraria finkii TaxID=1340010 RepID=A0ABR4AVL7_9LECA